MPPTPLSPDFDPLITSCDLTALSGFGGSLRPCCPKTAPGFAVCSVRIVLRRSSLCTVPVELPESTSSFADRSTPQTRRSLGFRVCSVRIVLRRSSLRSVPAEPPEGTSPFPVCSTPKTRRFLEYRVSLRSDRLATFFPSRRSVRNTRRHFVHRSLLYPAGPKAALISLRSAQFDPKVHQSIPVSVVGAGCDHPKSLSNPSHRRPTKILCRSILSSFCRLGALPISPVARLDEQRSAATRDHSTRRLPARVSERQSHCPAVAFARSCRTQRGLSSLLRNRRPHLADRIRASKTKSLNDLPISRRTTLGLDVMMLSPKPSRTKQETLGLPCG